MRSATYDNLTIARADALFASALQARAPAYAFPAALGSARGI
jgi:hypothetical protein